MRLLCNQHLCAVVPARTEFMRAAPATRPRADPHGRGRALRLSTELMAPPLRLSVLDQSPIVDGGTGPEALANTIDLARLCDALGYTRYWLAEHHGILSLACTSPEVLIAAVGAATKHM